MKRMSKVIVIIMCLFLITGCGGMSKSQQKKVLSTLKSEKVIDKKWKEVDNYTSSAYTQEHNETRGYGYIYKDKEDNMYEVYFSSYAKSREESNVEISTIVKYKISDIDDTVKKCSSSKDDGLQRCSYQWVTYNDESKTETSKYIRDESTKEVYKLYKTKHTISVFTFYTYKFEKP